MAIDNKKNEVMTTGTERKAAAVLMSESAFASVLQGAIGVSPLATGHKFTTDELVSADSVKLHAFDWVDYVEGAGTEDEREVHFTVWSVTAEIYDEKSNTPETIKGYYQGGTVMNNIANAITANDLQRELDAYGINVRVSWGKTNSKNKIALVTILG